MSIRILQPRRRPLRPAPSRLRALGGHVSVTAVAAVLALAAGCATGQRSLTAGAAPGDSLTAHEIAVLEQQALIEQQRRVDVVARRLYEAIPTSETRDSTSYVGLRLADPGGEDGAVLSDAVGVVSPVRPYVVIVDPVGPAAAADVLPGDQILAVADVPVREVEDVHRAIERAPHGPPVVLLLFRDGHRHEIALTHGWRPADLEITVVPDHEVVNAFARKRGIEVPTGMLRFLRNEHELAVILGHEIAHVVRGHLDGSYAQGLGDPRFARDLEREADRFALELAELAGYNPAAGVSLWLRFAQTLRRPFSRDWLATHPASRERVIAARRIAAELRPRQILKAAMARVPITPAL